MSLCRGDNGTRALESNDAINFDYPDGLWASDFPHLIFFPGKIMKLVKV